MAHKYDNTVIRSQGGEHGTRIIEWWEKQNVDTGFYLCNEYNFYYGLIDGEFGIYTFSDAEKANAKIIELPEEYLSEQDWETFTKDINPQIIDLSNVEGVEMWVREQKDDTPIKLKIIATVNGRFIDWYGNGWNWATSIDPIKKVTMQEVEQLFGCRVEIVKEVSNE